MGLRGGDHLAAWLCVLLAAGIAAGAPAAAEAHHRDPATGDPPPPGASWDDPAWDEGQDWGDGGWGERPEDSEPARGWEPASEQKEPGYPEPEVEPEPLPARPRNEPLPSARARKIERLARTRLGRRYVWGAQGPHRFDCSGFTWWVFNSAGIGFGRASTFTDWRSGIGPAWKRGKRFAALRAGDLVYLRPSTRGPQHVGIYLGSGRLAHASSAAGRVVISDMAGGYYRREFVGFLRHRGVRR